MYRKVMAVELTNVTVIPDQYLGHHNLAYETSELSKPEAKESFRRSNWTYPNISMDGGGGQANGGSNKETITVPPGQITYSWNNICVTTCPKTSYCPSFCKRGTNKLDLPDSLREGKQLLKNVNGAVITGELTCILGSSGAGKTTLLNTLTFQNSNKLKLSGERYINGELVEASLLSSVSAYVQQQDLFIGTLTVKEHLVFHALLRMHANIPYERRMERVDEVIEEFGLNKCANTIIGIPGRIKGISGGEQKRLAFASEILTDPSLMFCDEPTSGLDSFMAKTIVTVLKTQAGKGKGILCTIHQPSSELFTLFDKVLVMAEGRVAYFGPISSVLEFLRIEGYPCPTNYNPAEFLQLTLAIQPDQEQKTQQTVNAICDGFERSSIYFDLKKIIEDNSHPTVPSLNTDTPAIRLGGYNDTVVGGRYRASWFGQFRAVLWRSWISYIKDPFVCGLRLGQNIGLALLIGTVYYGQKPNEDGIQNVNGALFLFLAAVTYQTAFGVVDAFCAELPVFLREHFNGMYRVDVYYLSKVMAEIPFYILFPSIMILISYYMIGLNPVTERLLYTILIMILITNVSSAFGYFLSCVANTVTLALILAPALIFPFFLFGGFFLSTGSGPVFLRWIKHFSWFFYGYEALAIVQWKDVKNITCNRIALCPPGGMTGEMVLTQLGMEASLDRLNYDMTGLAFLVGMFQLIAFVALLSKTWRSN